MMRSLAGKSLLLFGICLLIVIGQTLLDPVLSGLSFGVQRLIIFLVIVLPAAIGAGLGVVSLVRREGQTGLAIAGVALNAGLALFHMAIILFAG